MTAAQSLLDQLLGEGVQLRLENDQVRFRAPAGALNDELRSRIQALRDDLCALVRRHSSQATAPTGIPNAEAVWLATAVQAASARGKYDAVHDLRLWKTQVDLDACQAALDALVRRHSILRTRFLFDEESRCWAITERERVIPIEYIDLTTFTAGDIETEARRIAVERAHAPFDLTAGPLLRVCFIKMAPEEFVSVFAIHHAIIDGFSRGAFLLDFAALYTAHRSGTAPRLPPLPFEFRHYAQAQNEWLESEEAHAHILYWRERLGGQPRAFWLPYDPDARSPQVPENRPQIGGSVDTDVVLALQALARNESSTLFCAVLAAFSIVLSRWSDLEDTFTWVFHSGRDKPELLSMVGLFLDSWPLRIHLDRRMTFRDALREVSGAYRDGLPHVKVTPSVLGPIIRRASGGTMHPATVFNFIPGFAASSTPAATEGPSRLEWIPMSGLLAPDSPLALHCVFSQSQTGLSWALLYNPSLFEESTLRRLSDCIASAFSKAARTPDATVAELAPQGLRTG